MEPVNCILLPLLLEVISIDRRLNASVFQCRFSPSSKIGRCCTKDVVLK